MKKSLATKTHILSRAVQLSSRFGLEGLSLGRLAQELELSKSGVYAHFDSKEGLQREILRTTAEAFTERVVRPALGLPRGEPRVVGLFEGWLRWLERDAVSGGCLFIAAATELDDREGPVREELVSIQRGWLGILARAVAIAQEEGHYDRCLDPEQLAFELHGIMLSCHNQARLLREPDALARARLAFAAFGGRARGGRGEGPRYRELLDRAGLGSGFDDVAL